MAQPGSGFGSSGSYWNGTASDFPAVPWVIEDFHGADVCGTEDGNIHVSTFPVIKTCNFSEFHE